VEFAVNFIKMKVILSFVYFNFPLLIMEAAVRFSIILALGLLAALQPGESRAECFSVFGEIQNGDQSPGSAFNYRIGIENPPLTAGGPKSPDFLFLWSLNLTVSPASPATTGDLLIVNAYAPTSNYLLQGRGDPQGLAPTFSGPANSIALISDSDFNNTGVDVPETGKYLLELDLQASSDAHGLFNIEIQPDASSSYWQELSDFDTLPFNYRAFNNLPFDSLLPVTIGTVNISNVPEPASLVILAVALAFFSLWRSLSMRKPSSSSSLNFPSGS
jgi:hypothetical protein